MISYKFLMALFVGILIVSFIVFLDIRKTKDTTIDKNITTWKKQVQTNEKIIVKDKQDFIQDTIRRNVYKQEVQTEEQKEKIFIKSVSGLTNKELEKIFSDL